MLYISTKCRDNISESFRVMEGLDFQYSKFSKGHNSVNKTMALVRSPEYDVNQEYSSYLALA